MAIPAKFDSNMPFVIVTGGSENAFLSKEADGDESHEEEKGTLVQAIGPHLSRVMQVGTAKHVRAAEEVEYDREASVSIVAQAEREDFQEFSPTNTKCPYTRAQQSRRLRSLAKQVALISDTEDEDEAQTWFNLQRKQFSRTSRPGGPETGEERPVIRGLWVQEVRQTSADSEWTPSSTGIVPPPPEFTDSVACACARVCQCASRSEGVSLSEDAEDTSSWEDGGGSEQDSECTHESDSSCWPEEGAAELRPGEKWSALTFDPVLASGASPGGQWRSDTFQVAPGLDTNNAEKVVRLLEGKVMQIEKHLASTFSKDVIKRTLGDCGSSRRLSEGLLFHHQLQPSSCFQYREGREYCVLHHIQSGSYGDVFCVQDKRTGFQCAAKKVPVNHFSSEEVSTWSALDSARVVELFGAVREGLNIVLFMDLKPACLAQLLRETSALPEDLALHYLHQTLGALEHLHRRQIVHLDVKADNVLLSADCRGTFLCDFGLSQTLDDSGRSTSVISGALPGTETHMAPEVAGGERASAKADVWSSCCMLLHMLTGFHPWTRYYSHPLCLQIVNGPPPLWEVPSHCNNFTAKLFRAGLQKEPQRRASAKELRKKGTKALKAVGGLSLRSIRSAWEKLSAGSSWSQDAPCCPSQEIHLTEASTAVHWVSPWRTAAAEEDTGDVESDSSQGESRPRSLQDDAVVGEEDWDSWSDSEVDIYVGEEEFIHERWLKAERDYEGDWEEDEEFDDEDLDEDWDPSGSTQYQRALRGLFPLLQKATQAKCWGSESELELLRDDLPVGTTIRTPSPEPRDDPPSCFSCSDASQTDPSDKESDRSSDDLSSGVFSSCNSHVDTLVDWPANQTPSNCLEGIDVWIENVQDDKCLRIRERRQVKIGHVAIGISDQVSGKTFTLETLDRKLVAFDQEIRESCTWLRCVPASDQCQRWRWRVRDGRLELRE